MLRVDVPNGKVWVNDSALNSGGQEYSLSGFMKAWGASDYNLTIVTALPQSASSSDSAVSAA